MQLVNCIFSFFCQVLFDNLFYLIIVIFIESRFHIDGRRNFFSPWKKCALIVIRAHHI